MKKIKTNYEYPNKTHLIIITLLLFEYIVKLSKDVALSLPSIVNSKAVCVAQCYSNDEFVARRDKDSTFMICNIFVQLCFVNMTSHLVYVFL